MPTVKHGGGSVMVSGCFAASGPGQLAVIDGTINSGLPEIPKEHLAINLCPHKRCLIEQQDNNPKHTWKSTSEGFQKTKIRFWCQSSNFNPIEMLFMQADHARKPSNLELKQFCKNEWAKIPLQQCERLITNYHKCLISIIAAKTGIIQKTQISGRGQILFHSTVKSARLEYRKCE